MEWPQILGAVGFGAIVTKLLDVIWLQRIAEQNERKRWLREKRYGVFSALAKELLTEGLWNSKTELAECLRMNAELTVLSPAKQLGKTVYEYFDDVVETKRRIDQFTNNGTSTVEERTELRQNEHERLRTRAATSSKNFAWRCFWTNPWPNDQADRVAVNQPSTCIRPDRRLRSSVWLAL